MTAKINLLLFILLFSLGINTGATQTIMSEASTCEHSMIESNGSTVLFLPDQSNSKHDVHGSIIALNTEQLQFIKVSNANAASKAIDLIENVCKDQAKSQPIKPGATNTKSNNKQTSADGVDWAMINNLTHMKEAKSLFE